MLNTMKTLLLSTFTAFIVLFCYTASAVKVEGLYQARLLVLSQDPKIRESMAKEGLKRVVVKASGSRTALSNPVIQAALNDANRYVQEFSYAQADESGELPLNLSFNKAAIEKLLRNADLAYWPENRPAVLLWMVADDPEAADKILFSAQDDIDTAAAVTAAMELRGLAIENPLLDLDDRLAFPADLAWRLDRGFLAQASERYDNDIVVLVRVSQTGTGEWRGALLVDNKGQHQIFDARGSEREAMLVDGFEQLADYLGSEFAVISKADDAPPVQLQLEGVSDFESYTQVLRYLNGLAIVRHAEPKSFSTGYMSLRVYFDGEVQQLKDAIALGEVLQVLGGDNDDPAAPSLYYLYQRPSLPELDDAELSSLDSEALSSANATPADAGSEAERSAEKELETEAVKAKPNLEAATSAADQDG